MNRRITALLLCFSLLAPGYSQAQSSNTLIPLLTNASASGILNAGVYGGNYQINLAGTVGGSTITLTESDSAGVQQTVATFTAVGNQCIAIGAKQSIQAIVTGGSPSGLYMTAQGVQYCPAGTGGGVGSNVNITGINSAAPSLTNPIFTAFAEAGDTTGTFTNATQTTAVTATNGDGYGTALISIHGTYGTATATFLASDDGGVTTYPLICTRSDNTASEIGYTTLTNTNRQWSCAISGNDTVIVQSSAVATGTVNVRIGIVASPNATTVNGTVNVAAITGATSNASSGVATSSTNIPSVSYNYGWNGTTWDQLKTAPAIVTTGVGLPASGVAAIFNTTLPTYTNGQYGMLQMTADGSLRIQIVGAAGVSNNFALRYAIPYQAGGTSTGVLPAAITLYNGTSLDVAAAINGAVAAGIGTAAVHTAPTSAITASTTAGQCTVACASLIVSGAHNIYGAGFSSTATGWLLLEDATSCAANGTVTPLRAYAYPTAGVTQTLSWSDVPRSVATGMAFCFSTSGPYTATASTTAFIWADYK